MEQPCEDCPWICKGIRVREALFFWRNSQRNSQTRPRTIRGSSLSPLNYEIGRFRPPTFVTGSFSSLICRLAPCWRPRQQSPAACSTSSRRAAAVARGSELHAPRRRGSHRRERGRGPQEGGREGDGRESVKTWIADEDASVALDDKSGTKMTRSRKLEDENGRFRS